jgi:hypothetical protein
LFIDKEAKTIQRGKKKTVFFTSGASLTGSLHVEEGKLNPFYLFAQSSIPNGSRTFSKNQIH